MYAVLYVANFSLQAVVRADPTLAATGAQAASQFPANFAHRDQTRVSPDVAASASEWTRPSNVATSVSEWTRAPRPQSAARGNAGAPAIAILSGDTKRAEIFETNSAARACGVEIGMAAPQAQARCAHLLLRLRSLSAEADAQRLLLACGLDVAPTVEDTAPGVCTIDVSGLPPDDRSRHVARAVCHLGEQGLRATGGIAKTPLLALYAAQQTTSVRTVENATEFLRPLPLSAANPPPEITAILQGWGITTLGQLTALPKQEIVRRLSTEGGLLWERARGGEPHPLRPYAPPQQFTASLELEYEVETCEALLFILRRFVDRLALELRTAGFVAGELKLVLTLADQKTHERSFRLPEPTAREEILFRTLDTYLESLRTDSTIVAVCLEVTPVRPLLRQPGLFETGLRDPHGFSETLARVTAIVGSGRLGTPELEDTHRPDAVKLVPPLAVVPEKEPPRLWPPMGLPLRRYRPPVPARVELAPSGHPAFISGAQLHSPIGAARGPWKSSGDWWKPESWAREEWDVELSAGGVYRIAKVKDAWYVDGEYE